MEGGHIALHLLVMVLDIIKYFLGGLFVAAKQKEASTPSRRLAERRQGRDRLENFYRELEGFVTDRHSARYRRVGRPQPTPSPTSGWPCSPVADANQFGAFVRCRAPGP